MESPFASPFTVLYPYQANDHLIMAESNVLLAYEMGLGKTPTTLATLQALRDRGDITGPGIIVVPASLKWQWEREVRRWTTGVPFIIHGSASQRRAQYERAIHFDYVIMTYDAFVRDWSLHKHIKSFLVLDEATAIKNFKSKRSQHFKKVRDRYPIRFALTGTPIENGNPEEIFSILEWVDPEILGKYWPFEKRYIKRNVFGWIDGYRNLDEFHKQIKPYVLRRTHKEPEVAKYLPKVRHLDPYVVGMDTRTALIYGQIADDILSDLNEMVIRVHGSTNHSTLEDRHPDGKMMGKIQTARMFLDHPEVVFEADGDYATSIATTKLAGAPSPKLDAVIAYVNDFLEASENNKVVIFTSFVHMASLLEICWGRAAVKFTGQMGARTREAAKVKFQTDPNVRVFVSTDAGGYGLDLPQANLLVNYDQPWQAGLLKQRNARIRRASSEWDYVVVQDFVVGGTLEERMLDMLAHKIAVSDAIIDGEGITEDGDLISDLDSLRSFLNTKEPAHAS